MAAHVCAGDGEGVGDRLLVVEDLDQTIEFGGRHRIEIGVRCRMNRLRLLAERGKAGILNRPVAPQLRGDGKFLRPAVALPAALLAADGYVDEAPMTCA